VSPLVVVKPPSQDRGVIRQHVLRGVVQGIVEPHIIVSTRVDHTYAVPINKEVILLEETINALVDSGATVVYVEGEE